MGPSCHSSDARVLGKQIGRLDARHAQLAHLPTSGSRHLPATGAWSTSEANLGASAPPMMDAQVAAQVHFAAYYDALSQQLATSAGSEPSAALPPSAPPPMQAEDPNLSLQHLLTRVRAQHVAPQQPGLPGAQMLPGGEPGAFGAHHQPSLFAPRLATDGGLGRSVNSIAARGSAALAPGCRSAGLLGFGDFNSSFPTVTATPLTMDERAHGLESTAVSDDPDALRTKAADSGSTDVETRATVMRMLQTIMSNSHSKADAPSSGAGLVTTARPHVVAVTPYDAGRAAPSGDAAPTVRRIGRKRKLVSFESIVQRFDEPIADAARSLGVCTSVVKKICRANGVKRWPYRKLQLAVRPIMRLQRRVAKGIATPEEFAELQQLLTSAQRNEEGSGTPAVATQPPSVILAGPSRATELPPYPPHASVAAPPPAPSAPPPSTSLSMMAPSHDVWLQLAALQQQQQMPRLHAHQPPPFSHMGASSLPPLPPLHGSQLTTQAPWASAQQSYPPFGDDAGSAPGQYPHFDNGRFTHTLLELQRQLQLPRG